MALFTMTGFATTWLTTNFGFSNFTFLWLKTLLLCEWGTSSLCLYLGAWKNLDIDRACGLDTRMECWFLGWWSGYWWIGSRNFEISSWVGLNRTVLNCSGVLMMNGYVDGCVEGGLTSRIVIGLGGCGFDWTVVELCWRMKVGGWMNSLLRKRFKRCFSIFLLISFLFCLYDNTMSCINRDVLFYLAQLDWTWLYLTLWMSIWYVRLVTTSNELLNK